MILSVIMALPEKGTIALFGLTMYFAVFLVALFILIYSVQKKYDEIRSPNSLFYILVLGFFAFRCSWYAVQCSLSMYPPSRVDDSDDGWHRNDTTFVLNRLSLCWFFAGISVILFNWVRVVDVAEFMTTPLSTHLHKVFLFLNIVVTVCINITIIVYMTESQGEREGNAFYDSGVLLLAVLNFIFMVSFIVYGIRLYCLTSEITKIRMVKILVLAMIFLCCFGLRVAMLMYRPVTGKKIYNPAFYTMCYFIPELIPIIVQVVFQGKSLLSRIHERKADELLKHDDL